MEGSPAEAAGIIIDLRENYNIFVSVVFWKLHSVACEAPLVPISATAAAIAIVLSLILFSLFPNRAACPCASRSAAGSPG